MGENGEFVVMEGQPIRKPNDLPLALLLLSCVTPLLKQILKTLINSVQKNPSQKKMKEAKQFSQLSFYIVIISPGLVFPSSSFQAFWL
jgi:hypothetical protein